MGRQARLRKERKLSTSSTKDITQPQDNSVLARASSLVKQPQVTTERPPSWSDKVLDWINPNTVRLTTKQPMERGQR